jgi:hypothetical protein
MYIYIHRKRGERERDGGLAIGKCDSSECLGPRESSRGL